MENKENNIKKNFSVPQNYFDNLEQQILSKTTDAPDLIVAHKKIIRPWMAMAASLLILFSVAAAWMWNSTSNQVTAADDTEMDYLEGMEDELFAALMYEEEAPGENNSLEELADFLVELEKEEEVE